MRQRNISHFFNDEYTDQAAYVNFSKIANVISGSKVTQQKVLSTMMTENISKWQKVEVVSSLTALKTLYLGGSGNIDGVTTNMGAVYVGRNNIPLIDHKGDFGGRLNNAAAASRYIFTRKGENFEKYLNKEDLNVLPKYNFEGQDIEYAYFTYTLPMVLVNGTEGLGSGYKSKILPRNPKKIQKYITDYLNGSLRPNKSNSLEPHYEGFNGTIEKGEISTQWIIKGVFKRVTKAKIEITELPIGENYKGYIKKLDALEEKGTIKGYDDLCDPKSDTFHFYIKTDLKFSEKSDEEIMRVLKLINIETEILVLNDENNTIKVFESIKDIMDYYIKFKMEVLQDRKEFMIERDSSDIRLDVSRYLFIKAVTENDLIISKRKKKAIEKDLDTYDKIIKRDSSYDYLLNMSIVSLTEERMAKLMKQIKDKKALLDMLKLQTLEDMWINDLKG